MAEEFHYEENEPVRYVCLLIGSVSPAPGGPASCIAGVGKSIQGLCLMGTGNNRKGKEGK